MAIPAVKLAVSAIGLALAASRHPVVRAGIQAAAANPQVRAKAGQVVRGAAYGAGVIARQIVGKRSS